MDVRVATVHDADVVARLLHDFNTEFDTPSPGPQVLAGRLRRLLATSSTAAVLAGEPAVAVALLTFRPNVWSEGPVALLDELYVRPDLRGQGTGTALMGHVLDLARDRGCPSVEVNVDGVDVDARRFYEGHGFRTVLSGETEPSYFYERTPDAG